MDKLNMQTVDVADDNFAKLAKLFPNAVTETIDVNGNVIRAIDRDVLMQEISATVVEGREERYQFTWPDKRQAIRNANSRTTDTLRPCREESVDFDNTQNLYLEGDNLEVLKTLRETYLGKVKMIYIDPPYNTGNDFVYHDDFAQSTEEFNVNSGLFDDEGNQVTDRMVRNTEANGRFHTDWLNMIYPRLKVARDLLTDDGVIFISIDDNEVENLKKVCDEIFGEDNFVAMINWKRSGGRQDSKYYAIIHEYILCYAKDISEFEAGEEIKTGDVYSKFDKNKGEYYKTQLLRKWGSNSLRENRPNLYYPIKGPNGEEIYPIIYQDAKNSDLGFVKIQGRWRWSASNLESAQAEGRIEFQKNKFGEWVAYEKIFAPKEGEDNTKKYTTWIDDVSNGTDSIKKLFSKTVFDYSKSAQLVIRFLKMAGLENNDICLDFFSGSATTAHAVMQLNAEDGGNRKFIMVQFPEVTDEKSEACKAGYKNICEIGKERIRRAGKKIKDKLNYELGKKYQELYDSCGGAIESTNPSSINYFSNNATPEKKERFMKLSSEFSQMKEFYETFDTGFRVLKLDSSNMEDVFYTPAQFSADTLFADNVKPDRSNEDLLVQVMLELGIELSSKIETKQIAGKEVLMVDENFLIACFDRDVNETTITEIAKLKPAYFVMRDASLSTDNVADNFEQIFKYYSKDTIRKIL
ncbi:MAG: site-specific DNA-methyltransferase [Muribaculaceae bacterium]|nr:site-specific DNA-methyltransferase [Muribaculaceae bacterium]